MKLLNSILLFFSVLFLSVGCKKGSSSNDYKCTTCTTAPEAKAANDASSKGIYKGIIIGSTGTIKFDVQNGGTLIKAYLTLDGVSAELSTTVTWNANQAFVGAFTGTLGTQQVSITFSVGMNGQNPTVTASNIPGHLNAQFTLIKENSTALFECFEGTYKSTKPETGTFNLILSRSARLWTGIHRKDGDTRAEGMSGTITTDGKLMQDGTDYVGTLSSDAINGSFKDGTSTITVTGKRTL